MEIPPFSILRFTFFHSGIFSHRVGELTALCKEIIITGVLSIQSGETPKFMEEKLISLLEQSVRDEVLAEQEQAKANKE